jgi:hypothetical protein
MNVCRFHVKRIFLLTAILASFAAHSQKSSRVNIEIKELPRLPPRNYSVVEFLKKFPEVKSMSYETAEWFYWTNFSRQNPKAFWDSVVQPLLNTYPQFNTSYALSLRKALEKNNRLPMLKPNHVLGKVSQLHAVDLSKSGILSHSSSNGAAFEQRVFRSGIAKCAAENLSMGLPNPVFSLVLLYLDEGLPDLGHRNNLLNPYYEEMGIGISTSKQKYTIVVQDFACSQSAN